MTWLAGEVGKVSALSVSIPFVKTCWLEGGFSARARYWGPVIFHPPVARFTNRACM